MDNSSIQKLKARYRCIYTHLINCCISKKSLFKIHNVKINNVSKNCNFEITDRYCTDVKDGHIKVYKACYQNE